MANNTEEAVQEPVKVRVLSDLSGLGYDKVAVGSVIELSAVSASALTEYGYVDSNVDAVAYAETQT